MSKGWFLFKWIRQSLNSPAGKHEHCRHEGTSWFDLQLTKHCSGRSSLLWWRWPALSLLVFLPGAAKWSSGETWEWCQKASEAKIWQEVGGEWQEVKCESEETSLFGHSTVICTFQKLQADMKALGFFLEQFGVCLSAIGDFYFPVMITQLNIKPNPVLWWFIIEIDA